MPFIGNQPALSYTSFAKQDFTTSATTSYTLDNPVTNANELALFINFVRQEPTTAYSASGTSLTLTSATSATDDMYCVYLGKAVQTVNPPNASVGISQLTATGTKDSTTFLRGDNTFASAGGDNTPFFTAKLSTAPAISHATTSKINFDSVVTESSSGIYDTTNYKFTVPSGKAGKYQITLKVRVIDTENNFTRCDFYIRKNGSTLGQFGGIHFGSDQDLRAIDGGSSIILDLAVGDYIEGYLYCETSDSGTYLLYGDGGIQTYLSGFKLVE